MMHSISNTHPCVLVVDDDQGIRNLIAWILRTEGLMVATAESGSKAIEAARCELGISVAILDWQLPGMRGDQVLDGLAAIRPGIRAIVASGSSLVDLRRAFAGRRVHYFLTKPFKVESLVTAVKSALAA
jgi:two-component system, OmpR family, response regulator